MYRLSSSAVRVETILAGAACEPCAGASASSDASASCCSSTEDIRILAIVVAELKLSKVQRQILFADMVERTDNATFEERPERFNVISVNLATNILTFAMAHRLMWIIRLQPAIAGMFVGCYQINVVTNSASNEAIQRGGIGILNYLTYHIAFPANSSDDADLAAALTTSDVSFLVGVAVPILSADEGFVYLNNAHKLAEVRIEHRSAKPMAHVPSSRIGRSDLSHDLVCADALLRIENLPKNLKPCLEWIVGVLKDRPDQNRETIRLARIRGTHFTSVMPRLESEGIYRRITAARTLNLAVRPTVLKQVSLTIVVSREGGHEFAKRHHA